MKVLWFSNTPASGADYMNLNTDGGGWLKALDKKLQHEVDLHISFHYPKAFLPFKVGQTHYYPITPRNWRIHMIKHLLINWVYNNDFEKDYLQLINEIKPDIIHIHGTENSFSCIIGKTNIPIVVSIQGVASVIAHKYMSGLSSRYLKMANINFRQKLKSILLSKSFKWEYNKIKKMAIIESNNLKDCQFIIGRTNWDRRITSILAPKARYNHVDEILRDSFYSSFWSIKDDPFLRIHSTLGNSYFKGFETICQSLNELHKIGIKIEWRIAGVKDTDLIVKLVRKKLGKNFPYKGLIFLGNLGEGELIKKMLEADFFVMASHIENSSNSLCEAMMLGMPCIATFAGGTGSLLRDGKEGILIQDGDPWALAGAILELSENRKKTTEFGAEARAKALQRHNKEKIINELLTIYKNIVNENSISYKA
jgi:glycosyltransferase involved in cell wall biosynthesis